jgi:hypothetical protein
MLYDKIEPKLRGKGRGQLSSGVVLLHDNSCPHTAAYTVETLKKLNFEVLEHPPYSPNFGTSDYHLFVPLRKV